MNLLGFFRKPKPIATDVATCRLVVDYGEEPKLFSGTRRVLKDIPAAAGVITITPDMLQLIPLPKGVTYREFRDTHPEYRFADARVLNAIISYIASPERIDEVRVHEIVGDFAGQIHFLGTEFEGMLNGALVPVVGFLNWGTYLPALRYGCPIDHPINHDVNCCACVMGSDTVNSV